MSTISASTTSTTAFKVTSDTTGTLVFQTGAVPTTAISIDASQAVGIGTSSPSDILTLAGGASGSYGLTINNSKVGGGTKAIFQYDATNAIALVGGNTTNGLAFQTLTGGSLTTKATIDSSGNLGLGVTPRAWAGGYKSFDITGPGAIASTASGDTFTQVANGAWFNGTNWIYQYTGVGAARYQMTGPSGGGNHSWHVAATGTAGNTVSFTQAMTLTAAGILCVGATSNTGRGGGNTTLLTYKASGTNYLDIQCGSSGDSGLVFSTASSGNYGLINYRNSAGDLLFYTTSVERMRLTATGLGISEANNPTQALSLYRGGSTNAIMSAGNSTTGIDGTWFGVDTAGNGIVNVRGAFPLLFSTSAIERARITSGGYSKFSNTGTYSNSALYHEFYQTNNNTALLVRATNSTFSDSVITVQGDRTTTNGTYYLADFYNGNVSGRFRVLDSGNAQNTNNSYAGTSDIKLKQDIVDASSQWDDIKSLRIRKYRFKHSPDAPLQIGLVAQESETVSPGLVEETIDRDEEGNDLGTTTKSVKYSVLYMKAVKALQEAMARIEQLEAKFAALESK